MVIRWRKATRCPHDRASASSTSSPLRMTTTPLFSAVSGEEAVRYGCSEDEHDVVSLWLEKGKSHECPASALCT
ncbi:hypothetical protein C4D60_Mb08t26350 [Musa balbisiana]|uniref:Uncharacterized protein n=1 Tax=Musa balbisiana TaxID=52838 RepID=A0A4S8K6P1_MUSBA|nr:hypothetical protein C4D60_Mb08t26350 [Musa balbisiana]